MIELRMRSQISDAELEQKVGKILTDADYNVLLTGAARVLRPNGSLLCIYVPGALDSALIASSYETLHSLRVYESDNRPLASGTKKLNVGGQMRAKSVPSAIVGAVEKGITGGRFPYCRLTAWTGREMDQFRGLFPLFQAVGSRFKQLVPDRYAAQMSHIERTPPEWVIQGTPFTTITVNNTYPTGVHTDKGDLDEGFSCLAVLRYGQLSGGRLTFPRYRVSVDMQHGDLLLMDAHEWHGNTAIVPQSDDAERISIVCYYRTKMEACGSAPEEAEKGRRKAEALALKKAGIPA